MSVKIGITTSVPHSSNSKIFFLNKSYINAIRDNGGMPIIIPTGGDLSVVKDYAQMLDGLLIPGGEDINPMFYNQQPNLNVKYMNIERDNFEAALIQEVVKLNKPILGICRGLQLINVAFGGTLIQDVPTQFKSEISHLQSGDILFEPTHLVVADDNSFIKKLLGNKFYVNSFHHQAIDRLASGFKITAKAADGLPEAIECDEKNILAVQWHPEELYIRFPEFSNIFRSFIEKSSKKI